MGRRPKDPYVYERTGRKGFFAFVDGQYHIPLKAPTFEEAQKELGNLVYDRRRFQGTTQEISLTEIAATAYKRSVANNTAKTAYEYHKDTVRLLKWLEERNIYSVRKIDANTVQEFIAYRKGLDPANLDLPQEQRRPPVSNARIYQELHCLKNIMKVVCDPNDKKYHMLDPSVLKMIPRLKIVKNEPHQKGVSKADIEACLAVIDRKYVNFVRMVAGTAMRDEEAKHLDAADIRADKIVVSPKPPGWCKCCPNGWTVKGWRYRDIPASPETVQAARKWLEQLATEDIKTHGKTIWKAIKVACAAAGVGRFSLQDLRRSFASQLLSKGWKLAHISKLLGHKDVLTTMLYLRIVDEMPGVDQLPW